MNVRFPSKSATANDEALPRRDELRSILTNLSQELSRPLISLRAGFDLLLDSPGDEEGRKRRGHILTMASMCDDLLRLTQSYLDFAGMVHGRRPIQWGSFSLGALFSEIESQFAPLARHRGIAWRMWAEDSETTVRTDASKFQQILGNLAANAIKFTPPGGTVDLRGRVDRDSWTISIHDTGDGIPPEALGKVFEPFYRLTRDEHAGIEGNGLGLAICRELVEQLLGEIRLESALGRGTAVTVRFPLGREGSSWAKHHDETRDRERSDPGSARRIPSEAPDAAPQASHQ